MKLRNLMRNFVVATLICSVVTISNSARADDAADLAELLKSCNARARTCEQANRDKDALITKQHELLNEQLNRIKDLEARQDGVLKSPILWFALGLVTTGITVRLVRP